MFAHAARNDMSVCMDRGDQGGSRGSRICPLQSEDVDVTHHERARLRIADREG